MCNKLRKVLKSKIKILVTHHVHHLEHADQILILSDGEMVARGKYNDLIKQGINLSSYLSSGLSNNNDTCGVANSSIVVSGATATATSMVAKPPLLPMIDLDTVKRNPSIKSKDANATTIMTDSFKIQFTHGSISTLNTLFDLEKLLPSLEITSNFLKTFEKILLFLSPKINCKF